MKTLRLVVFSLLLMVSAVAQQNLSESITATFTWQASRLSGLQLYAANVCNGGPTTATVQSYRDVWPRATEQGIALQTPVAIQEAEASVQGKSAKAWVTYLLGGGCAIAAGVTNSGTVTLDKSRRIGKLVAYGTAACAVGLPIWASTMSKVPGGDKEVPYDQLLPAVFVLGPGDCKQYLVYVASPPDQKILTGLWQTFNTGTEKK